MGMLFPLAIRYGSILNQYGIDMGDITQLAAADKRYLRNLKIGQLTLLDGNRGRRAAAPHWEVSRREANHYDRTAA